MQKTLDPAERDASANPSVATTRAQTGVVRSQPFPAPVLLCGIATTALTLIAVYVLDRVAPDFNLMGWYANKILPMGAIIVGVAASCGYGIAAWYSGLKVSKKLLWVILALQTCAYFGAQYIEFSGLHLVHRGDNTPVSFFEYFDLGARSFAWKQHDGTAGEPLGVFGYFFRALELIGFAAGGLIVPAVMRGKPYCEKCVRYMHTKELTYVPASIKVKKISKKDIAANEAQAAELEQALNAGKKRVEVLQTMASEGKVSAFEAEVFALKSERKKAISLPIRFVFELVHCKSCRAGRLKTAMLAGLGQHVQRTEVGEIPVSEEFVHLMRNK